MLAQLKPAASGAIVMSPLAPFETWLDAVLVAELVAPPMW